VASPRGPGLLGICQERGGGADQRSPRRCAGDC
jgi:hypothetical protein